MPFDCERLKALLTGLSLVKDCQRLKDGTIRMATNLRYPNGSFVDIFVHAQGDLGNAGPGLFKGHVLSDMGQTALYLLQLGMEVWATEKRKLAVEDVCKILGVESKRSQLQVKLISDEEGQVADAFLRLAQACIRIADLSYMQRFAAPGMFKEEVAEFLTEAHFRFEPDIVLAGKYDTDVPVDFRVKSRKTSLLRLISGKTTSATHVTANEVFRCWHDLSGFQKANRFITLVDARDRMGLVRGDDAARLAEMSEIVFFPTQERQLASLLAA
ncbi:MAG TPA: hypothetical protein DDY78_17680 [Planctomycetales bacterium]|jgi:hypothetical protein|nr:hypothetical protein [Planctomycetales bacterium]